VDARQSPAGEAHMTDDRQHGIVVGISGSRASLTALRWAAAEARLRGASLHVVRAWDPARHAAPYAGAVHVPTGDEHGAEVRAMLAADMRAELGPVTPEGVTAELAEGTPERVMVAQSARADLLVLGVTTPPWLPDPPEGPVIRACLAHARCPVVVVGSAGGAHAPADRDLADSAIA
jgi:nucleotide-binding universal stress UspA family protein